MGRRRRASSSSDASSDASSVTSKDDSIDSEDSKSSVESEDDSSSSQDSDYHSFDLLPTQKKLMVVDNDNFTATTAPDNDAAIDKAAACIISFTVCLPEDHDYCVEDIEDALEELMNHHEMLRTVIKDGNCNYCANVGEGELAFQDMRENEVPDEQLLEMTSDDSIDIHQGPLWRVVLHSGFKLFWIVHRLVADEASCRFLAEDLCALLTTGRTLRNVVAACSFETWVDYLLNDYAEVSSIVQIPFWEKMLAAKDNPWFVVEANEVKHPAAVAKVQLTAEQSTILLSCCSDDDDCCDLYQVVLTCLARALYRVSGQAATSVGLLGRPGRMKDSEVDVTRTVGQFQVEFPLLLDGGSRPSLEQEIKHVSKLLKAVPDNGVGFMAMEQQVPSAKSWNNQILFDYHDDTWYEKVQELHPDWSLIGTRTTRRPPPAAAAAASTAAVVVACGVHRDNGSLEFVVGSRLSQEKTQALTQALQTTLAEAATYIQQQHATTQPAKPRKKTSNAGSGKHRRSTGKNIRPSKVIRNFSKQSIAEHQYMFFIHPGVGRDASMYQPLADALFARGFNPKGIDNNILATFRNSKMAKDLNRLAKFYAKDLIVPAMSKKAGYNAPINLFGWSLGGKIALETAYILESQGASTRICVFLLDAFLSLADAATATATMGNKDRHPDVLESEYVLAEQALSGTLKRAKVVLFKSPPPPQEEEDNNKKGSFDNGLSKYARKLTVIHLEEYHHHGDQQQQIQANQDILETVLETVAASASRNR